MVSIPTCIIQPRVAVLLLLLHLAVPPGHLLVVLGQEHLRHGAVVFLWANFVGLWANVVVLWACLWSSLEVLWSNDVVFEVVLPCFSGVGLQVGGRAATEAGKMGDSGPDGPTCSSPSLCLTCLRRQPPPLPPS